MNIPDYQSLMLPLLQALADGREHLVRDVRESIAAQFGLNAAEREALLPSGKQPVFGNREGAFLTSSPCSSEVREYVSRIEKKIVLVDGQRLAALMVDFGIGVAPVVTYELKRVDTDYFSEEG